MVYTAPADLTIKFAVEDELRLKNLFYSGLMVEISLMHFLDLTTKYRKELRIRIFTRRVGREDLSPSSNRTCRFPASGLPLTFT